MPNDTDTPKNPQPPSSRSPSTSFCASLRALKLTLKRRWFDMIAAGIKCEEYRKPGKWILSRLRDKEYDLIEFKNGYGVNVPTMIVEYNGWHYGSGKTAWGYEGRESVIVISLGDIVSLHNR